MYEDHFGLTGRPFQLTPDPRFWFETATHRKAMAYLGYGLAQGEGFIVVTGDIGAGKTTLVGHLMERIDATRLNPIRIVSTQIEADDLLRIVAGGLGIDPVGKTKSELLVLVERGLHSIARTGRRTLLIVDEVQALPVSALEELRMLSNFQAGGHALLQILLLGQPEFRERLHGSERLEQLRQRVIATHHLDPMEPGEVEAYVAHRLSLVGWQGRPDFADDAFPALFHASGGVPRRLNQLAGRILLHCAVEEIALIDAAVVELVAADGMTDVCTPEPVAIEVEVDAPKPVIEQEAPEAVDDMPATQPEPEPEPTPEPASASPLAYLVPPAPRPMTPPPAAVAPRPIRLAAETAHPHPSAPEGAFSLSHWEREVAGPAEVSGEDELPATSAAPQADHDTDERIAALEARLEVQDAALRRVLTLLVDWVEGDGPRDGRTEVAALRDAAA
ncbi:ExeA family protein [uncultured Sphingomonas sp.]|uniref:ExeA family protein n=1 Tax=uncultured Sphingomonas sp. TaxID=158754 RepID=UPI0035CC3D36